MKKITFFGYYGMRNYGDDLFSVVTRIAARRYCKNYNFEFLFVDDRVTRLSRIFSVVASRLNFIGSIFRLIASFFSVWGSTRLVFCGGSLFSDASSRVMILLAKFAISRGVAISALGVSVGPFSNPKKEKEIGNILSHLDFVTLRDDLSFRYMKNTYPDVMAYHYPDLAGSCETLFSSGGHVEKFISLDKFLIGFSACNFEPKDRAFQFVEVFIDSVRELQLCRDVRVLVLNLNANPSDGDVALNRFAFEELSKLGVNVLYWDYHSNGVLETYNIFSTLDIYVGARLHGALTAFFKCIPFVLLEYHRKCSDFLDDIGVSKENRLDLEFLNSGRLSGIILNILTNVGYSSEVSIKYASEAMLNYFHFFENITEGEDE